MPSKPLTYASSGVSIAANDQLVRQIQRTLKSTHDDRVLANRGGFAGLFRLHARGRRMTDPVLVGCSDGVGSKVLVAIQAKRVGGLGQDLVAMNVNDLVTCGAEPLFFLDYVAVHRNTPTQTAALVRSIAAGCRTAGCALLGGETAEMPALYRRGEFDLAGFSVGVVERKALIDGRGVKAGDVLVGLASSGLHSNGYSLVRKVLFEVGNYKVGRRVAGLRLPLGQELLRPTRIYVQPLLKLLRKAPTAIRAMAHITGGGLPGNVGRALPARCRAEIDRSTWKPGPLFRFLQAQGVADDEMFRVFNMGIGMVLVVPPKQVDRVLTHFKGHRIAARPIGTVHAGRRRVDIA